MAVGRCLLGMRPPSDSPVDHLPALRRYALTLTRRDQDADDLVQDVLVKALQNRGSYRGLGLRAWLFSILHNTFLNNQRGAARRERRLADFTLIAEPSVEPAQDHVVRLAQLQAAFLDLPIDQRAALHLVVVEGLGYQQAADALGVPLGTLMSRLARARAALRQFETPAPPRADSPRLRIVGGDHDR